VVALAGDTVDITEKGFYINGALQREPDIYRETERYQDGIDFPLTVLEGHVFVLGDNRTGTTDSRIYGPVRINDTQGKVMTVVRRRSI
jgi:signal peptidase I